MKATQQGCESAAAHNVLVLLNGKKMIQLISGLFQNVKLYSGDTTEEYAISSPSLNTTSMISMLADLQSERPASSTRRLSAVILEGGKKAHLSALHNLSRFPPGSKVRCIFTIQKINGSCFHTTCSLGGGGVCQQPHKHSHPTLKHRALSLVRLVKTQNVPQPR